MSDLPSKVTVTIPVSNEVLEQSDSTRAAFGIAMGLRPDPRTPEQMAADRAAWEAKRRQERVEAETRHAAALANAEGIARAVLELHAPVSYDDDLDYPHCDGCDAQGYEWEHPDFPCQTWTLVAEALS